MVGLSGLHGGLYGSTPEPKGHAMEQLSLRPEDTSHTFIPVSMYPSRIRSYIKLRGILVEHDIYVSIAFNLRMCPWRRNHMI